MDSEEDEEEDESEDELDEFDLLFGTEPNLTQDELNLLEALGSRQALGPEVPILFFSF